jgi:hypothetical protein
MSEAQEAMENSKDEAADRESHELPESPDDLLGGALPPPNVALGILLAQLDVRRGIDAGARQVERRRRDRLDQCVTVGRETPAVDKGDQGVESDTPVARDLPLVREEETEGGEAEEERREGERPQTLTARRSLRRFTSGGRQDAPPSPPRRSRDTLP